MTAFSEKFYLLQQECFIINTSYFSALDYMKIANFDDYYKGAYYGAFFNFCNVFERILKILLISQDLLNNNYKQSSNIDEKLRKYGHRIDKMYIEIIGDSHIDSIDISILEFLTYFASASHGRYYNITENKQEDVIDPIKKYFDITHRISYFYFGMPLLSFEPVMILKCNNYASLRIHQLIQPICEKLFEVSKESHDRDTKNHNTKQNKLIIPYYDGLFTFYFLKKERIFKKKTWARYPFCL